MRSYSRQGHRSLREKWKKTCDYCNRKGHWRKIAFRGEMAYQEGGIVTSLTQISILPEIVSWMLARGLASCPSWEAKVKSWKLSLRRNMRNKLSQKVIATIWDQKTVDGVAGFTTQLSHAQAVPRSGLLRVKQTTVCLTVSLIVMLHQRREETWWWRGVTV